MRNTVRWVDKAQKFSQRFTPRNNIPEEFLLICTGGASHLVFLAAQLERFRMALGGADVPLVVLARHDAGAAFFLFDDRAEVMTVDMERLGEESTYRGNRLSEMYQSHFKGMVTLDYHRHPYLDEALIKSARRPAMAMKPAPLFGLDQALANNAEFYQNQFDCGQPGTPIPGRWNNFAFSLSGENSDLPAANPYRLDDGLLPDAVVFETPTVLLQPFSPDPSRQYPAGFYGPIIDALPGDCQVLLLGDQQLLERTPDIKALLERENVSLEETDLARAMPMMLGARLVIAMDGAPMHLAAISGAPTLGLAPDAGNGDLLPYPQDDGPGNTRILIGDDVNADAAIATVRDLF